MAKLAEGESLVKVSVEGLKVTTPAATRSTPLLEFEAPGTTTKVEPPPLTSLSSSSSPVNTDALVLKPRVNIGLVAPGSKVTFRADRFGVAR
jgi:hypothetical protein